MADEFIYAGDLSFKSDTTDSGAAGSGKIEKGLKRLLIIAGIILAAELIWLFGVSPCIPLSTVEIQGFPGFDGQTVLSYAGIGEGASYISVKAKEAEKLLAAHYMVESARVIKRFPDRLSIFLEERRAVALSLVEIGDRPLPVYYDKYGVVFRIGDGAEKPLKLPLVSGLEFENPVLGARLSPAFGPFLSELARIGEESPELLAAVSEIRVNRKAFNGFDLVLYPVHYPIRVRLGEHCNEETLRYVLLVLDVLASGDSLPDELDFRSGVGAYKVKEAPSGG
jgi:cell division protein FtsQ